MRIRLKPKVFYVIPAFTIGFLFSLAGMTFEDYMHDIPIADSLVKLHHFVAPFLIGLLLGFFAFLYWMRRKEQLVALNQFTENINSLLAISNSLISTIDLDQVLQIIIDKSTHLINLETGAIYLHLDDKLYLGATTPPLPEKFPEILRHDLLSNHPHIQRSINTHEPAIIPDTSKEAFSESEQIVANARNLKSILFIPLIIENRPIGTMILGTTSGLRNFSKQEIDIYKTYSGQAALAIENARLYRKSLLIANELRQQNEEFSTLNEELSENNRRIQQINEDLKIAKAKAEESDRLKTSFLQNMSHEIRTPLNAIAGFSMMLSEPNLPNDKISKFIEIINESSNKLISIISDVIEISQIQSNSHNVVYHEFDIKKCIDEVIQEAKSKIGNSEIDLFITSNIKNHQ